MGDIPHNEGAGMEITVSKHTGRVEVTVLSLSGQLDGQTYQELIGQAKTLYAAGARNFLFDLGALDYISSAGLVAIHTVALLLRGVSIPDSEDGWASMKSVKKDTGGKMEEHLKLLNPQPDVKNVLEMVGFDRAFEMYPNLEEAVHSF
jgi:anti-anti-sigma regulatory factor